MKKTLQRLGIATVGLSLCLWSCKEPVENNILTPVPAETHSIEKDLAQIEQKVPNLDGLKFKLPSNVSEKVIFSNSKAFKENFHVKLLARNKDAKARFSQYSFDLKTLENIIKKAKEKYPNFEKITEGGTELKKYFPELTEKQFSDRKNDIDAFFNQLIINEAIERTIDVMTLDKSKKSSKILSDFYSVKFDEWWFYITHSDYGSCAAEVKDKALMYANRLYAGEDQQDTRADAFRHAFWMNMLAKYGGSDESEVETAAIKAGAAGFYHEYGLDCWTCDYPPKAADSEMDLHNNYFGTDYFKTIAWTYVSWGGFWGLFADIDVDAPSDDWISSAIAWRVSNQSVQVSKDINSVLVVPRGTMVYFN